VRPQRPGVVLRIAATPTHLTIIPAPRPCPTTTAKSERLRQAKAEAEKEIGAYRAEREGAYQKKLAEVRPLVGAGGGAAATP
jgi:hypothetical protein